MGPKRCEGATGEMAALLAQAGNIVVVSGSDQWRRDRQQARERHVGVDFVEIALNVDGTFLEALQHRSEQDPQHHPWVCVDEPYENPENPELTLPEASGTDTKTSEDNLQTVLDFLKDHQMILDDCGASSTKEKSGQEDYRTSKQEEIAKILAARRRRAAKRITERANRKR